MEQSRLHKRGPSARALCFRGGSKTTPVLCSSFDRGVSRSRPFNCRQAGRTSKPASFNCGNSRCCFASGALAGPRRVVTASVRPRPSMMPVLVRLFQSGMSKPAARRQFLALPLAALGPHGGQGRRCGRSPRAGHRFRGDGGDPTRPGSPSGFPRIDEMDTAVQKVRDITGGKLTGLRRCDRGDLGVERGYRPPLLAPRRRDRRKRLSRRGIER